MLNCTVLEESMAVSELPSPLKSPGALVRAVPANNGASMPIARAWLIGNQMASRRSNAPLP